MHAISCMGGAALRAAISRTGRSGRRSATPKPSKLRTKEVAVCSTAQSSMTIQLRVHKHVEFGEAIHAVGAITELGGWVPELGAALSWCEGDFWAASVRLPVTEEPIKFKYVVVAPDGHAREWEQGEDRELPIAACFLEGPHSNACDSLLEDYWHATASSGGSVPAPILDSTPPVVNAEYDTHIAEEGTGPGPPPGL